MYTLHTHLSHVLTLISPGDMLQTQVVHLQATDSHSKLFCFDEYEESLAAIGR